MFYSFAIISNFCLVPVPLQWIYVVIETKEIHVNLSNPPTNSLDLVVIAIRMKQS